MHGHSAIPVILCGFSHRREEYDEKDKTRADLRVEQGLFLGQTLESNSCSFGMTEGMLSGRTTKRLPAQSDRQSLEFKKGVPWNRQFDVPRFANREATHTGSIGQRSGED